VKPKEKSADKEPVALVKSEKADPIENEKDAKSQKAKKKDKRKEKEDSWSSDSFEESSSSTLSH